MMQLNLRNGMIRNRTNIIPYPALNSNGKKRTSAAMKTMSIRINQYRSAVLDQSDI